jgi:hypothetical protein
VGDTEALWRDPQGFSIIRVPGTAQASLRAAGKLRYHESMKPADRVPRRALTTIRWIARIIFVVALLTWGRMAVRAGRAPETWAQTRQRTAAFLTMVFAGMLALPRPKDDTASEETY